jgi:multidrug efflux pump subunit AcrA (membrane-fusion protein)
MTTSKPYQALLIPRTAIGRDQNGGPQVLIVGDHHVLKFQPVTIGRVEGQLIVVKSGLKNDERVVVNVAHRGEGGVVDPEQVELPIDKPSDGETKAGASKTDPKLKVDNQSEFRLPTSGESSAPSAKLEAAIAELDKQQKAFDAGIINQMPLLYAKSNAESLKAESAGKFREAAEIRLKYARQRLDFGTKCYDVGLMPVVELEAIKAEVATAEAQVRDTGK